ncbi:MAG: hypothetical protein J5531_09670 [Lachnospiraceae bacterium]|nr:hypothetical protein [Lachnospiraceae bacterium]
MVKCSELRKDNHGIAMISVMICATLCLLLSATILRVSLLSYRQKAIGKQSASTFYENEVYVDDIKMGLQAKVASAVAVSSTTSRTSFVSNFKTALLADGGVVGTDKDKLEKALTSYLTGYDATAANKPKIITVTVEGYTQGGTTQYFDESVEGEIVIKNVRIRYTDVAKGGYVSEVKTDIRIRSPYVSQTPSGNSGGYSMFAGGGFSIEPQNTAKPNVLHMRGDIYIGYDKTDTNRITTVNTKKGNANYTLLTNAAATEWQKDTCIQWEESASVTINGDVYVKGYSKLVLLSGDVDVRGKIYISSTSQLIVSTNATLKCQDIILNCSDTDYSGGDSIADGYEADGANENTTNWKVYYSLPKPADSHDKSEWWYDGGKIYDGLYLWDGSKAERVYKVTTEREEVKAQVSKVDSSGAIVYKADGSRDKEEVDYKVQKVKSLKVSSKSLTSSGISCITLDAMNFPDRMVTKKIDGTNYEFDVEFVRMVDVEYYIKGTKNNPWTDNAERLSNHPTDSDGNKWESPYTYEKSSDGQTVKVGRTQNFKKKDGGSVEVKVMVGSIETGNNGSHFFMPSYGTNIVFNDQNNNMNSFGIYISPGKIVGTAKEQNSYISSLLSLVDGNAVNAKKFFDGVGRTVLPGSADEKYRVINNMFNGGIKIFYSDSSSSTGGGSQTITNTDRANNASLEIISFENWEKNPQPATTS